jgi:hypothetical protein
MQVFLPEVLKPKEVKLKLTLSYISPKEGSDRTGVLDTKRKNIYYCSMVSTYVRI